MTCRSGCPTPGAHGSWGECLRAALPHLLPPDEVRGRHKAWDNDLARYRDARRQGIQPASTSRRDVDEALALSRAMDRPFNAADGSFK